MPHFSDALMSADASRISEIVDAVYRSDSRRILATLIRLIGDFDLAEESLHQAFAAAVEHGRAMECLPILGRG